jgi:putative acetyltransferase
MKIRQYQQTDLEPVASLFTESVHLLAVGAYDAEQRMAWAPQPLRLDFWRERLSHLTTLVAEIGGELAGFISYEDSGHIDLLYTAPAHVRSGIATALYGKVENVLGSLGVDELFTQASLVARPFFERQGFRIVDEQRVVLDSVSLQRYAMRKSLTVTR